MPLLNIICYILVQATSALDNASERIVQHALDRLAKVSARSLETHPSAYMLTLACEDNDEQLLA